VDDSDMVGKGYRLDITRMSVGIIDDDFLYNARKDWFKKIIAHLPLNGSPILEGVDLLPPYSRHQEDGVDDAVMEFKELYGSLGVTDYELSAFSKGYNKARQFYVSRIEEQILNNPYYKDSPRLKEGAMMVKVMLESTNQYPTEFESEMETIWARNTDRNTPTKDDFDYKPKTITTAQGVQWVGKYK
jgi:hypothetical protein